MDASTELVSVIPAASRARSLLVSRHRSMRTSRAVLERSHAFHPDFKRPTLPSEKRNIADARAVNANWKETDDSKRALIPSDSLLSAFIVY